MILVLDQGVSNIRTRGLNQPSRDSKPAHSMALENMVDESFGLFPSDIDMPHQSNSITELLSCFFTICYRKILFSTYSLHF